MDVVDFNDIDLIFDRVIKYNDNVIMRNIDKYIAYRKENVKLEGFALFLTHPSFLVSLSERELSKVDNIYPLYTALQSEKPIFPELTKKQFICQLELYGCGFKGSGCNKRVIFNPMRFVERV